jgi:hypothetical protein
MKFKNNDSLIITPSTHFHDKNDITILRKAILNITTRGLDTVKKTVDFLFNVGTTNVVKTDENDIIIWAKRKDRTKVSRFVKNRKPEQTKSFTFVAKKTTPQTYKLITCYRGILSPPEIKPTGNSEKSIKFWSNHAFVYGSEEIEGSILQTNPYNFATNVK